MNNDARLIDETLAGNTASFGELVCKYQDRLFHTMVHVVGSREEAEDVVQDAFVKAFVKLKTFQGASAFYTWLYRIAFNVSVSRKRRKIPELSVETAREVVGSDLEDRGETPSDPLERKESIAQVQCALAALHAEQRAILILREIEGNTYEEISKVLNLPIGTVRSRLHRARLQFFDRLKEVLDAGHE